MINKYMKSNLSPPVSVSTLKAEMKSWQDEIKVTGSLRAIYGVNVTTEIAGLVREITFKPGTEVKKGMLLVKLNDDTEVAQLHALEASLALAKITYERDLAQYKVHAVSKQIVDNDAANVKNLSAQVEQQKSIVNKKNIRAPFSGRIGICEVNPGQYLNPGDKIASLQTLDPIYVDFYLPQQQIVSLRKGQKVNVSSDAFPHLNFSGQITTINPNVNVSSRNIEVEATIRNPQKQLLPGMFVYTKIISGKSEKLITVPQTAISFNPYGQIIYLVNDHKDKKGKISKIASQKFVTVGETRGDQIAILKGIEVGNEIITSGQVKLKNGSPIEINNDILPENNPHPKTGDK